MDWKNVWHRLATFEPAALRGVWVALLGLATALGLQVSDTLTGKADAVLAALVVIVPLVQGLWTRQAVVPVARFAELEEAVTTPMPAEPTTTTSSPAEPAVLDDPSEETP